MPLPGGITAGPRWSKNTNGPTFRRFGKGRIRRTLNPPRSRTLGSIRSSTASDIAFLSCVCRRVWTTSARFGKLYGWQWLDRKRVTSSGEPQRRSRRSSCRHALRCSRLRSPLMRHPSRPSPTTGSRRSTALASVLTSILPACPPTGQGLVTTAPASTSRPARQPALAISSIYTAEPDVVVIAVHGMNDYAGAFNAAGAWWSAHGATVYAYDQRGFGRSPGWMIWPRPEVMRQDLDAAVAAARRAHPAARIAVVGENMAPRSRSRPLQSPAPKADALILSGPDFGAGMSSPWYYSASLWVSTHVRPDWIVVPPKASTSSPPTTTGSCAKCGMIRWSRRRTVSTAFMASCRSWMRPTRSSPNSLTTFRPGRSAARGRGYPGAGREARHPPG